MTALASADSSASMTVDTAAVDDDLAVTARTHTLSS
jgi:hypothetical protein